MKLVTVIIIFLMGMVVGAFYTGANCVEAQSSFTKNDYCSEERFAERATRDLCRQVQAQGSEISKLHSILFGHLKGEFNEIRNLRSNIRSDR